MTPEPSDAAPEREAAEALERNERRKAQNRCAQRKFRSKKAQEQSDNSKSQEREGTNTRCHNCLHQPPDPAQECTGGGQSYASQSYLSMATLNDNNFSSLPLANIDHMVTMNTGHLLDYETYFPAIGTPPVNGMRPLVQSPQTSPAMAQSNAPNNAHITNPIEYRQRGMFDTSSSSVASSPSQGTSSLRQNSSSTTSISGMDVLPTATERNMSIATQPNSQSIFQMGESPGSRKNGDWALLLHIAAEKGHESIVRTLLESDIEINQGDSSGATALHLAARHHHNGILKLLVESGADVNATDLAGWTPVHETAEVGNAAGMKFLLMYGANMTSRAKKRKCAISI